MKGCVNGGRPPRPTALVTEGSEEVLRLLVPVPPEMKREDVLPWGMTLGFSLRMGMRHLYMLDGPEIEFAFEGPWKAMGPDGECSLVSLSFIDPSIGGTGYMRRIAQEFHLVAGRAIDHLQHPDCETACYRCLKSYANQRHHGVLLWPLAIDHLDVLAAEAPASRPLKAGDIDDAGPWLEAYAAGVGSPLELKFLRLFEKHDFYPVKQFPASLTEGTAPISIADFALPELRRLIYIDGAAFHVGANLRRDRFLRDKLRKANPPWEVVELRAKDLGQGGSMVENLRRPGGTRG